MKIWKNLKQKFSKNTKRNYNESYLEIDEFPLDRWEKCQKNEFRYVNFDKVARENDAQKWIDLYNQYLEIFGLGEDMENYLNAKIHLARLRLQYLETGDGMILNYIAIEEGNVSNLDPSKFVGMTIDQCLVHLSKWMGQMIQKKAITIVEFKNLMNEYVRSGK